MTNIKNWEERLKEHENRRSSKTDRWIEEEIAFMSFTFILRPSHLKVISSICSDITAGFILLAINAKDMSVLTGEILFVILCMLAAIKLEDILELL